MGGNFHEFQFAFLYNNFSEKGNRKNSSSFLGFFFVCFFLFSFSFVYKVSFTTLPQVAIYIYCVNIMQLLLFSMHFDSKTGHFYPNSDQITKQLERSLTLVLLSPDIPYLCKQCRFRSVGF